MEEKKCKHCSMMIPKDAKVCPHCRKKQDPTLRDYLIIVFCVFGFIWVVTSITGKDDSTSSLMASAKAEKEAKTPVLELQKWSWYKLSNFAIAEGAVKNISPKPIDNVVAVFVVYDKQGGFIKADNALIDYRPILPGQASPFKVYCNYNPKIHKASIDFKVLSGGTLRWKKKEKQQKGK